MNNRENISVLLADMQNCFSENRVATGLVNLGVAGCELNLLPVDKSPVLKSLRFQRTYD